jgi:hypothetical protein
MLAQLDSVAAKTIKKGGKVKEPLVNVDSGSVIHLGNRPGTIREGRF